MSKKQFVVSLVVAVVVGVALGGIDRLFNVDLGFFPFLVPLLIFGGEAGVCSALSKKNQEKTDEKK